MNYGYSDDQPEEPAPGHWYRFGSRYFTEADIMLVLAALFFPPLAVYLQKGFCPELLISLFLSSFGDLPGLLYSLYLIYNGGRRTRGDYTTVVEGDIEGSGPELLLYNDGSNGQPRPQQQQQQQQRPPQQPPQQAQAPAANYQSTYAPGKSSEAAPAQQGSSAPPPTYEQATEGGPIPQTGDHKVQR